MVSLGTHPAFVTGVASPVRREVLLKLVCGRRCRLPRCSALVDRGASGCRSSIVPGVGRSAVSTLSDIRCEAISSRLSPTYIGSIARQSCRPGQMACTAGAVLRDRRVLLMTVPTGRGSSPVGRGCAPVGLGVEHVRPDLSSRPDVCARCRARRSCCYCDADVGDLRLFARGMAEWHQRTGTDVCGCGVRGCPYRARLDRIDQCDRPPRWTPA